MNVLFKARYFISLSSYAQMVIYNWSFEGLGSETEL